MHWWVCTPQFEYVEPILDDGSGPMETAVDCVSIDAPTKRKAIIAGVKQMRSEEYFKKHGRRFTYYGWAWDKETNPFTGVTAESAECPHGVCFCEVPNCPRWSDVCDQCDTEYKKQCKHEEPLSDVRVYETDKIEKRCMLCWATEEEIRAYSTISE